MFMSLQQDGGRRTFWNVALALGFSAAALASSPCRGDLTHYYPFSADVSDAVGSADGTLIGGATVSGGVLNLDGTDDYVEFGEFIVPTSGSFSIAMFAQQTTSPGNYIELISQGGGPGFYLGHDPGGIIRASDGWLSTGVPFLSGGDFHHYALTVDTVGGSTKLYVDGSLSASLGSPIGMSGGGTNTRFGRQYDGHAEYFFGALDDVRIYDHALTAQEVAQLAVVPEPATIGLAILGVLLAFFAPRVRR
jgi:hypothetical protein